MGDHYVRYAQRVEGGQGSGKDKERYTQRALKGKEEVGSESQGGLGKVRRELHSNQRRQEGTGIWAA